MVVWQSVDEFTFAAGNEREELIPVYVDTDRIKEVESKLHPLKTEDLPLYLAQSHMFKIPFGGREIWLSLTPITRVSDGTIKASTQRRKNICLLP